MTVTNKGCEPMPLYVGEDLSAPDGNSKKRKVTLRIRVRDVSKQHGLTIAVNRKALNPSKSCPQPPESPQPPETSPAPGDAPAVTWLHYEDPDGILFKKGENLVTAVVQTAVSGYPKIDQVRLDVVLTNR